MIRVLDRYIAKELLLNWMAVTTVLMLVLVSNALAQLLGKVADGALPVDVVLPLLAVNSIKFVSWILPLSAFFAVMLVMGRLYRDNEMSVIFSLGNSPLSLYRPVMLVLVPVTVLSALISLWWLPEAEMKRFALQAEAESRSEVQSILPGRFIVSRDGSGVFYVERYGDDGEMQRIFIRHRLGHGEAIESAIRGRLITDEATGQRSLLLEEGHRVELLPPGQGYRLFDFERHLTQVPEAAQATARESHKASRTANLLAAEAPKEVAELHWRFSQPLAILILGLLAVPLSQAKPRQGRFAKIGGALLLYITYVNLLALGRSWVEKQSASPWESLWLIHLVVLMLALWLLALRMGWLQALAPRRVKSA